MVIHIPNIIKEDKTIIEDFKLNEVKRQFRIKFKALIDDEFKDVDIAILKIKPFAVGLKLEGIDMMKYTTFSINVSCNILKRVITINGKFNTKTVNASISTLNEIFPLVNDMIRM